jgi:hypothetical protein
MFLPQKIGVGRRFEGNYATQAVISASSSIEFYSTEEDALKTFSSQRRTRKPRLVTCALFQERPSKKAQLVTNLPQEEIENERLENMRDLKLFVALGRVLYRLSLREPL